MVFPWLIVFYLGFCYLFVHLCACAILQEAQKVEAACGAAGAQPSRATQVTPTKASSPTVEAMAPRAASPAVDVPRPREPMPTPANP